MNIENMTPHVIVILDKYKEVIYNFESVGSIRIFTETKNVNSIGSIPITRTHYISAESVLPERKEDTIYIVSKIVCEAAPDREDFYIPNEMVKDETGKTIGCRSLAMNPCINKRIKMEQENKQEQEQESKTLNVKRFYVEAKKSKNFQTYTTGLDIEVSAELSDAEVKTLIEKAKESCRESVVSEILKDQKR